MKRKIYLSNQILSCYYVVFAQCEDLENLVSKEENKLFHTSIKELEEMLNENYSNSNIIKTKHAEVLEIAKKTKLDKEILNKFYKFILLISQRYIPKKNLVTEVANDSFLRCFKYRKKFDIDKISKISKEKVNVFSYLTQIIKNVYYSKFIKKKFVDIESFEIKHYDNFEELENEILLKEYHKSLKKFNNAESIIKDMAKRMTKEDLEDFFQIKNLKEIREDILLKGILF